MKYFDVVQGEEDWFLLRKGIPTASRFDMILTPKTLKPSSQQETLIEELIGERFGRIPPEGAESFTSRAIRWGQVCEAEARHYYSFTNNVTADRCGFCMTEDERFGSSPDFLIGLDLSKAVPCERVVDGQVFKGWSGATCRIAGELKCPQAGAAVRYALRPEATNEFAPQCHGHNFVCEPTEGTHLLVYCPGIQPVFRPVPHDEYTEKLRAALEQFYTKFEAALRVIQGPLAAGEILG